MADAISHAENLWRSLTKSVCEGKDKEARALLDENPTPMPEWFYFNALLRFRELGDCIQSRSALSTAFNESPIVAVTLTDSEAELEEQDKSQWGDEEHYALITQPAWQKSAGALPWLSKRMETACKMFGAADEVDETRVKKWQREGLMGQRFCLHQLKRHDDEKLIYDRLHSIDEHFDADDEYQFVCDAALVNAE